MVVGGDPGIGWGRDRLRHVDQRPRSSPAEDPAHRDRLPLDALLHRETYGRPDDGALAAAYLASQGFAAEEA